MSAVLSTPRARALLRAERDDIIGRLPRVKFNTIGPHNLRQNLNALVYVNEAGEVCVLTHFPDGFGFLAAKPNNFVGDQAPFAG